MEIKRDVFEQSSLAGIKLKNRIIRSATHEGMADHRGFPTQKLRKLYVDLAKGDVGAIITGYAGIQQDGKSSLFAMSMIDSDECIPAYKGIVDAVHEYDTPIIMQIAHCGRQTRSQITGMPTVAPSALRDKFFKEDVSVELSEDAINEIIHNFVAAIVRAQKAGFDGVQLHLAHGYLLSEFLSPYSNRRQDSWGGSTENRFRIVSEIFREAKAKVGDYPILVKLNAYDGRKNGMRTEEAIKMSRLLEKSGCAAIEVSCGVIEDGLFMMRGEKLPVDASMSYMFKYKSLPGFAKTFAKPLINMFMKQPKPIYKYNLDAAIQIKNNLSIPVIVVGGINDLNDIKDIIENDTDYVSMCRPFIIEPNIVRKFKQGVQTRSKCIMCNNCTIIAEEKPLKCYHGKLPKS
jgi:2,4-dienoyl-CoA reductase-like NADH-dependent reductase (Old Yellow Enzyme family)